MEIAPVPPARRADAVRVLVAAFWDYPETAHLLPDPARRRRVMPRYLASDVADTLRHGRRRAGRRGRLAAARRIPHRLVAPGVPGGDPGPRGAVGHQRAAGGVPG